MSHSIPDWDTVFEERLPRIYNYFLYRVNHRQTAEDLTATTFERAWSSRENYCADIASFSTWLFTIAHRVAIDHYRKRQPKLVDIDNLYHLAGAESPENVIHAQFEKERLANAIASLPEREQEIIALKYGAELNNIQIAELLNLSPSNVGTIAHRTVEQIRRILIQQEVKHAHEK
ncbi:MAG: sigma-70 family RNA polymerase sigma factor [Phototrophicaceae bacterium]